MTGKKRGLGGGKEITSDEEAQFYKRNLSQFSECCQKFQQTNAAIKMWEDLSLAHIYTRS